MMLARKRQQWPHDSGGVSSFVENGHAERYLCRRRGGHADRGIEASVVAFVGAEDGAIPGTAESVDWRDATCLASPLCQRDGRPSGVRLQMANPRSGTGPSRLRQTHRAQTRSLARTRPPGYGVGRAASPPSDSSVRDAVCQVGHPERFGEQHPPIAPDMDHGARGCLSVVLRHQLIREPFGILRHR
jgi:hypothetical protein